MGAFLRVSTSGAADCNNRTSKLACRGMLLQDDIARQRDMSKMRSICEYRLDMSQIRINPYISRIKFVYAKKNTRNIRKHTNEICISLFGKESKMPKEKSPPVNLDKYLEGRNHKYMTYEKASRLYGMPYWTFVSLAKEANATWKLRKTAMVDLVVLEKYLEEHCQITKDEDVDYEVEDYIMSRARKEVENLEECFYCSDTYR